MIRSAPWVLALTLLGCDGAPVDPPPTDSGRPPGSVRTAQINAYEGQRRFVTVLEGDEPLDGATVEADPVFRILEQRCAGVRCGVVAEVLDTRPNTGAPVPFPIDAEGHFFTVRLTDGREARALVNVLPLDTISAGGTEPVTTGGVRFASSLDVPSGATVRGEGAPLRWIVFGDARLGGTLDVSADGATPGPGGFDPGLGPTAGAAGDGGGGGGGHGLAGAPGDGPGGEPGAGGAGGDAEPRPGCASDFFAAEPCAGSGGGGDGAGAGGGAGALIVLGALEAAGGTLRAAGGDGTLDGGGGAGGAWWVAAASGEAPAVDLAGGAGAGLGGAGGEGAAGVEAPGALGVDLGALPAITSDASWTLTGAAAPGARVFVERADDDARVEATADDAGAFSVTLTLSPGLNRFRVYFDAGDGERRSWVGTSIEQERRGSDVLPTGALVDVAFVP